MMYVIDCIIYYIKYVICKAIDVIIKLFGCSESLIDEHNEFTNIWMKYRFDIYDSFSIFFFGEDHKWMIIRSKRESKFYYPVDFCK